MKIVFLTDDIVDAVTSVMKLERSSQLDKRELIQAKIRLENKIRRQGGEYESDNLG